MSACLLTCSKPVWRAIYAIEYQIDELDKLIDKSSLDKCFDCRQESKIACCYKTVSSSPATSQWDPILMSLLYSMLRH